MESQEIETKGTITPHKKWLYIAKVLTGCQSCVYIRKEMKELCCHHPKFMLAPPFKKVITKDNVMAVEIPIWCPLPNKKEDLYASSNS